jgi:hypothetical protein
MTAMALLATVFVLLAPTSDAAPAWVRRRKPAALPTGLAGSWLARAPPLS